MKYHIFMQLLGSGLTCWALSEETQSRHNQLDGPLLTEFCPNNTHYCLECNNVAYSHVHNEYVMLSCA